MVILVPPADPTTNLTSPLPSMMMVGHMELKGRFPGAIMLAEEGGNPKKLLYLEVEKSSI